MKFSNKHPLSLTARTFLTIFFVSATTLIFFTIHNYHTAFNTLQEQIIKSVYTLNDNSLKTIDAYINSVQSLCLLISTNQEPDDINSSQIVHLIRNFSRTSHPVTKAIYFVDNDGSVISNYQTYYDVMGNPMLTSMVDIAHNSLTGQAWSQPYRSPISGYTVNFTCAVTDKHKNPIGTIIVELNLDHIQNDLTQQFNKKGYAYILTTSENNPILFDGDPNILPYDHPLLRTTLREGIIETLSGLPAQSTTLTMDNCTVQVTRSQAARFGWNLYTLIDRRKLFQSLDTLRSVYLQTAIITLATILCVSFMVSRYFTSPIRQLNNRMKQFSGSDLDEPLVVTRRDEIGQLADSYNIMLLRIQNLISNIKENENEKQRLEFNMLQSQIQPHFLYNTLACISSLANQKRTDEIRQTVESMTNLFSYTFNKTNEYMTLREEIFSIQMYIQIQKVRYGDTFDVDYFIEDNAANTFLPKLTLQPIVENAIFHGIHPCKHRGLIQISASIINANLSITICDNGTGIDPERFNSILHNQCQQSAKKGSMNHVGLYNVNRRIILNFGKPYGISLGDSHSKGTCIKVLLPKIESKTNLQSPIIKS